eukprot:TRINITY_DN33700_c0_g1_i1.p1 TRINITY_DN33700_c0_g1~~TRINITY_DN33700_c0_g1_i1.p1  ORF type:complete len:532 (+),score=188.21 TRINITY_DN33700_c0_g1_i1:64-1659(+)
MSSVQIPGAVKLQRTGVLHKEYVKMLEDEGATVDGSDVTLTSDDVLVVVDMQNDFLPKDSVNPKGGRFGVSEGQMCSGLIIQLINKFLEAGARVVATRDYHPVDHVSFVSEGGPFPAHCVQGAVGSHFYQPIEEALRKGYQKYGSDRVIVAFKGFHEDIDSFGSFEYPQEYGDGRLQQRDGERSKRSTECGLLSWTGCHVLKMSAAEFDGEVNMNAPPDIFAINSSVPLSNYLTSSSRCFVTGLALDFCVLDTAITGSASRLFKSVSIILDASRAAHIPGVGPFGSGFLTDPKEFTSRVKASEISMIPTVSVTQTAHDAGGDLPLSLGFPYSLGPLGLRPTSLEVAVDEAAGTYTVKSGMDKFDIMKGFCTSHKPIFLFPLINISALSSVERLRYLAGAHDPKWEFFVNGGFHRNDMVEAVSAAVTHPSSLQFNDPDRFKPSFARALLRKRAFHDISIPLLQARGYTMFTWLGENEIIVNDAGEKWCDWPHGAFVYLNNIDDLESCIMFTVKPQLANTVLAAKAKRNSYSA